MLNSDIVYYGSHQSASRNGPIQLLAVLYSCLGALPCLGEHCVSVYLSLLLPPSTSLLASQCQQKAIVDTCKYRDCIRTYIDLIIASYQVLWTSRGSAVPSVRSSAKQRLPLKEDRGLSIDRSWTAFFLIWILRTRFVIRTLRTRPLLGCILLLDHIKADWLHRVRSILIFATQIYQFHGQRL